MAQKHIRCVKMDAGAARDNEIELMFNTHLAAGYDFFQAISAGVMTVFVFTGDDTARANLMASNRRDQAMLPNFVMIGAQGAIEQPSAPGAGPAHGSIDTVTQQDPRAIADRLLASGEAYVDAQGRTILGRPPGQGV